MQQAGIDIVAGQDEVVTSNGQYRVDIETRLIRFRPICRPSLWR